LDRLFQDLGLTTLGHPADILEQAFTPLFTDLFLLKAVLRRQPFGLLNEKSRSLVEKWAGRVMPWLFIVCHRLGQKATFFADKMSLLSHQSRIPRAREGPCIFLLPVYRWIV